MSWKRNVFGCLMWVIYLLTVVTAMIFTCRVICDTFGLAEYFKIAVPAGYLLSAGILVLALHRMAVKLGAGSRSAGSSFLWLEALTVLALFGAGLFLRVANTCAVPEDSAYLKLAYISADGQGVPPLAHGAVYLYLWALRLCFMLLGNKAAAAVWLQVGMQIMGVWMLYLAVRKMAGRIPAVVMLSFFMLSPYLVGRALLLSPEMLYLLGFSFVLLLVSQGVGAVFGWSFWLVAGALAAGLCYLDLAGFLLLPLMLGVIVMKRQEAGGKIVGGLCGCAAGFLLGAGGCILADMACSGKSVPGIAGAWAGLYRWAGLQLSVTISSFSTLWMITLILCFMAWGIFSFWCGRGAERFSIWILCLDMAVALQGLGMFTEEMDGFCYIFFFSTVLAGLGIRESMTVSPAEESGGKAAEAANAQGAEQNGRGTDSSTRSPEEKEQTAGEKEETMEEKGKTDERAAVKASSAEENGAEEKTEIEFIENPLPLPKKHEKRVMDYRLDPGKDLGGYDVLVPDDDDFDH